MSFKLMRILIGVIATAVICIWGFVELLLDGGTYRDPLKPLMQVLGMQHLQIWFLGLWASSMATSVLGTILFFNDRIATWASFLTAFAWLPIAFAVGTGLIIVNDYWESPVEIALIIFTHCLPLSALILEAGRLAAARGVQ